MLLIQLTIALVDSGAVVRRVTTERDIEVLQKGVAAGEQRFGRVGMGIDTGLSIEDDHTIGTTMVQVSL